MSIKGFVINGQTQRYDYEALDNKPSQDTGVSEALKTALLQLAQKVAYIDDDGADYYQALYDALYESVTTYAITNLLTAVVNTNSATTITENALYTANLTCAANYEISTVTVTMGGTDITSTAYSSGTISIPNVTGNIVITAVATQRQATLSSISAVFTQGQVVIYETTPLNDLKQYLVVTANWSDSSTSTVASSDYTLSGTLTEGTSTITVSYGGKTTTFSVTVSGEPKVLGYVGTNLIMMLDGDKNGASGAHNSTITTLVDQSGNNYNWVTGVSTVTATTNALVFNGSSSLVADSWGSSALTTPKTVEVVVDVTNSSTTQCLITGLSLAQGVGNATGIGVIGVKSGYITHNTGSTMGCTSVTSGVHTYSFVNNNGTWVGYKDGTQISFGNTTVSWNTGYKRLGSFIGASGNNPNYYFTGSLYNYRIYSDALSAEQIAANYANDADRFGLGA